MSNDPRNTPEERERILARLAAEALGSDAVPDGGSGVCPDAEVLAAYADRSVDAAEAARWESHFADCPRCRKSLAALVVSADEPLLQQEVQKLGERAGPVAVPGASAPVKQPVVMRPRNNPRWIVPAIAAAAAVLLWFVLRPTPPPTQFVAQNTPAANSALPNLPAADSSVPGGVASDSLPNSPADSSAPGSEVAQGQVPPAPAPGFALPGDGGSQATQSPFAQNSPAALDAARQVPPAAAAPTPPATAAPTPPATAAPPPTTPQDAVSADRAAALAPKPPVPTQRSLATVTTETPLVETQKTEPVAGAFSAGVPAGLLNSARLEESKGVRVAGPLAPAPEKKAAPLFTFISPEGAQWRGGTAGLIEHSVNQGRDWQAQPSGVTLDLAAGSASSNQVAWVVGHAGVILRTTDGGMSWQRIVSPDAAIIDWIAVQSSDAQHATVTGKDQHRFTTTDGGQSWTPQP